MGREQQGRVARRPRSGQGTDDIRVRVAHAIIAVRRDEDPTSYWAPYGSEDEWRDAELDGPTDGWGQRFEG